MRRSARLAALALALSLPALVLGTPSGAAAGELAELDRRLAERVFRILEARAHARLTAAARLPELPHVPELPPPALPAAGASWAGERDASGSD